MNKQCSKMRIYVYDKEKILEYAKKNIEKNGYFEIDYYTEKFQYNGESLEEIGEIFDRWNQSEVLIKIKYEREKIVKYQTKLKEVTEDFIKNDIENEDDVLKYLYIVNKIIEKYRTKFPGAIKPECRRIHDKLRKSGYSSTIKADDELIKYKKDYVVMACLSKKRQVVANILISDAMQGLCSFGMLDSKIGDGITEYYNRFIKNEEQKQAKVKVKVKQ